MVLYPGRISNKHLFTLYGPPIADLRNDSSLAEPTNGLFGGGAVTYSSLGKGLFRGAWNSKAAVSLRGYPARVMGLLLPWSTLHDSRQWQ